MRNHKKELIAAVVLLGSISFCTIVFFTFDSFRHTVLRGYSSIFKSAVSDRVLADNGIVYSNLQYCKSNDPYQTLDIFLPQKGVTPYPLVIFIHGGGWRMGDKSNRELSYYGEDLLNTGIAIASVNYRLGPTYTYPFQDSDIACALEYLSLHAQDYRIQKARWGLFGDSAGAQLAAAAMANPRINSPLVAFVGFYGPYDLDLQIYRKPIADKDARDYTNNAHNSRSASPYYLPPAKHARYLLYHGIKDRIVPAEQSERFADKLRQQGIAVTYVPVHEAGHSFTPRTKPSSAEIKRQMVEFYKLNLTSR